jgi:hypothetical protein
MSPVFSPWLGKPPCFDFGSKQFLDFNGEACFAELLIMRTLTQQQWTGAWAQAFGGRIHYLTSMPRSWSLRSDIAIPPEKKALLESIWKAGNTRSCFDVFVWRGADILFCEAKWFEKKDKFTPGQVRFIGAALKCGVRIDSLLIVEWSLATSTGPQIEA